MAAGAIGIGPGRLWSGYCKRLNRQPLSTKALTSVAGFALGDILAQLSTSGQPWHRALARLDHRRIAKTAAFGGLIAGPMGHAWFGLLDKNIMPGNPTHPAAIALKAGCDQAFMAPLGVLLFYTFNNMLDGRPDRIKPVLQDKFVSTMVANYKLWPIAHVINFAFVPSSQRVLYVNLVSVLWTMILSKTAASEPETGPENQHEFAHAA